MNVFSAIKGIFSGGKVVEDIFDKDKGILVRAGGWIDGLKYTEQEGAEDNIELIKIGSAFVKDTLEENTIRSKTRRKVAVGWIQVQIFMILLTVAVAPYDLELAEFYAGITFGWLMTTVTLAIIGFFFGTHMLRARQGNANGKPRD